MVPSNGIVAAISGVGLGISGWTLARSVGLTIAAGSTVFDIDVVGCSVTAGEVTAAVVGENSSCLPSGCRATG